MRILSVFSTWHPTGYKKYGDHFIQGFLQNWPTEVQLSIYAEDHEPNTYNADNIEVLDQRSTLPDLKAWQEKHKDNPHAHGWNKDQSKKSFLWDASRFANKTFALWHFAEHTDADIMIWCDGDVRTHTPMPMEFLQEIAPNDQQLTTHLGRKTWPECGWMMFNRHHPDFEKFMTRWRWIYESDDIFDHAESHDSFIFGELIQEFKNSGHNDLGGSNMGGHVFINSVLGRYMDHLKGFRKEVGKSLIGDVYGARAQHFDTNNWWEDLQHVTKRDIQKQKEKNPHEYDATQEVKSTGIKKWKDK